MSFISSLYKISRTANTISKIASGNPKRIRRRARNIVVGRTLRKVGFWKLIFGK